ncbi:HIT family protein [Zeimonas arvi]|uniref:HIT family protein n=1 Tax=Zeimonas arvi TaxID=2498847 RepID=A0A5C8NWG6_9BURK|nr:HIT family protein [Zeimonas arvi]TXL65524.1 HIT family protein [Zeimonas arvi]
MTNPAAPEPGASACPLCAGDGGERVWRDDRLRVILAAEPDYPGFTRVVWRAHVAEMTDLPPQDRDALMRVVCAVESAQREAFAPDKINLASFGNMVPHLHWHVIPRWRDDRHFPEPVWGRPATGRDDAIAARRAIVAARLPRYLDLLRARLARA